MLRAMGAEIYSNPGRELVIEGKPSLSGTRMHVLGDRIEAAAVSAGPAVRKRLRGEQYRGGAVGDLATVLPA